MPMAAGEGMPARPARPPADTGICASSAGPAGAYSEDCSAREAPAADTTSSDCRGSGSMLSRRPDIWGPPMHREVRRDAASTCAVAAAAMAAAAMRSSLLSGAILQMSSTAQHTAGGTA